MRAWSDDERGQIVRALQEICRNDATDYAHHQERRFDGKRPSERGGTIWLTPREIARQVLRGLEEAEPDPLAEMLRGGR